ncbi:hypothetical protein C0J52_06087 [Blattella germanica]|nr:hypothetical protein C0J52_06087 [Blattella germanica]
MACRQIKTVGRHGIIEDPIFETARQTLNQAIDDFRTMTQNVGLPRIEGTQNMSQALSCIRNYQTQQPQPQQTPFTSQYPGPLSVNVVNDRMTFKPDRFEIIMDVQGFKPEDISITLQDNVVDVSAERQTQDSATAQCFSFHRRYFLPQNIKTDALVSNLSSEGVLVLSAPWLT